MRIYISLPISGRDIEDVAAECVFNAGIIESKGHKAVSPLELSDDVDADNYNAIMGNCIAALLDCDAILMCGTWHNSKGCRLEYQAANIYYKKIYYDLEQIPRKIS